MSGNGVDIAAVYQLLSRVAETVTRHSVKFEEIDHRLQGIEKTLTTLATKAELAELRQTVTHYHSSVIGHGILISDLEARMRRVEERLDLPPMLNA